MINEQKVRRAVELQNKANDQIKWYGQTSEHVMDELMELVDGFNDEEQDAFTYAMMGDVVEFSEWGWA